MNQPAMDTLAQAHIRGLSADVWRNIRVEAVRRDITVARLIEMMWQAYTRNAQAA